MFLFRLLLEVWRFGAWMEFITIGSSVLALPGHSSAQTELCSWLTNFSHCSAQNSLHLASKQSLDLLSLNNACCLFPAFMDWSGHQPALLSGTKRSEPQIEKPWRLSYTSHECKGFPGRPQVPDKSTGWYPLQSMKSGKRQQALVKDSWSRLCLLGKR